MSSKATKTTTDTATTSNDEMKNILEAKFVGLEVRLNSKENQISVTCEEYHTTPQRY